MSRVRRMTRYHALLLAYLLREIFMRVTKVRGLRS